MGELRLPSLGADMERATILEWRVAPGDEVRRGDIVVVVDTEKSDIEVETWESGVVAELLVDVGDEIPVGTPIARLGEAAPSAAAPVGEEQAVGEEEVVAEHERARPEPVAVGASTRGAAEVRHARHVLSPVVRHLADELGIDAESLEGTGPGGVVTRADVAHAAVARATPTPEPASAPVPVDGADQIRSPGPASTERPPETTVRSSPYARHLADQLGIALPATGSGPDGAVVAADVLAARDRQPPAEAPAAEAPAVTDTPAEAPAAEAPAKEAPAAAQPSADGAVDPVRVAIARLMARSKREIPHYYVSTTVDAGPMLAWLEARNADRPPTARVLPAAVVLAAVARAARDVPELNGWWRDERFEPADGVRLGVAIARREGGLVAPAIDHADAASLDEIMAGLRDLVARVRSGRLRGADMADPSITVTNLGDTGVESVIAVIYPPQVAMVGVGRIQERPWVVDGELVVRPLVEISLAADHRATDGRTGARFLAALDRLLADPATLDPD
ncbi:MAG TPA: dihydrolipoamide acetyltransferase family protein [Acidimicrobiales bacterium]|nr:dihydrolipoamide acetyltransferase family protein [Acidimicrobiales bacterium]